MTLHQVHQLERELDAMKKELAESQKQLQVCYGVVCGVWCGQVWAVVCGVVCGMVWAVVCGVTGMGASYCTRSCVHLMHTHMQTHTHTTVPPPSSLSLCVCVEGCVEGWSASPT